MGVLLHTRYGYVIVVVLILLLIYFYYTEPSAEASNDRFITLLDAPVEDGDLLQTSFVESELVNLTDFRYTLKSQVCNSIEDLLGK